MRKIKFCRRCKLIMRDASYSDMASHWKETHGVSLEIQRDLGLSWVVNISDEEFKESYVKHRQTGKGSSHRFDILPHD